MDSHEVERIVSQLQQLNKIATEIDKKLGFLAGEKLKITSTSAIGAEKTPDEPEP